MKRLYLTLAVMAVINTHAQQEWSVWECMDYAVEHNHDVKKAEWQLDTYKANRLNAIGSFMPSIGAGIGMQYNSGRAINPETNTYTDVSTFNNSYNLSASMPVFDGFAKVHALNVAKADLLYGKSALEQQKSQTALATFQAYINVLYYQGTVAMAEKKLEESRLTLKQTHLMKEIGRKSVADVAQIESQFAADEYLLVQQQNSLASAILSLKKEMNYPLADTIVLKGNTEEIFATIGNDIIGLHAGNLTSNPELQKSYHAKSAAQYQLRQSRSTMYPAISAHAGIGTNYNAILHAAQRQSFRSQFKNNRGEYVGISVNIPIFNRLSSMTGIRKARNNYRIACENYEQKLLELRKLSAEAVQDFHGYLKETEQLKKKVASDSITYSMVKHQYDEGLATAIDLQTSASALLNSRASLLKSRLMAVLKRQLVRYYFADKLTSKQLVN